MSSSDSLKVGRVYKIVNVENESEVYIGSTFQTLSERFSKHCCSSTSIGKLIRMNGKHMYKPVLIAEYNVVDEIHLRAYEQLYISTLATVNQMSAFVPNRGCIRARKQKYAAKNHDMLTAWLQSKETCDCGCEISRRNIAKHRKSAKHANRMRLTSH